MSPDKNYPADRKYHPEHTWARAEEDGVVVGISYFAQDELGEVLFVELPEVGEEIQEGRPFGVVESAKVASLVNEDPYGAGWMIKVEAAADQLEQLLEAEEYARDK